jgi:glycerol uptake facilitator-like aquaporin
VVYATFGSSMAASVTLPADDNVIRAFVLETVMTFTLVYVVSAATTSENKIGPLAGTAVHKPLFYLVYISSVPLLRTHLRFHSGSGSFWPESQLRTLRVHEVQS